MSEVLILGAMEEKGFVEQKRRLKTPSQVEALENIYAEHKYPSETMKSKLSMELGLSEKQVQRWFRHRRLKDKKGNSKKEEPDSNEDLDAGSGNNLHHQQQQQREQHHQVGRKDGARLQTQRLLGVSDYPSAVLAAELTDHDVLKRRRNGEDFDEETHHRAGNGSLSQDTSSLQSRSSNEIEALRNGIYGEIGGDNTMKRKGQTLSRGMEQAYPQHFLMASEERSGVSVLRQCGASNGSRQVGGGNYKQMKNINNIKEKNNRFDNSHDYPSAVLAAEVTDRELLKVNHDVEDPYVSVSQERSSLHSGSSYEIERRIPAFKRKNPFETEAWCRRRENEGLQIAPDQIYFQQYSEHQAISAVKAQLGRHFQLDGPALGVEFDPLPPGAFGYREVPRGSETPRS